MMRNLVPRLVPANAIIPVYIGIALIFAVSAALTCCVSSRPAQGAQDIGSFIIGTSETKFGDGAGMYAWVGLAMTGDLLIKCSSETHTLVANVGGYDPHVGYDESLSIQVLVDGAAVIETTGTTPQESDSEKAADASNYRIDDRGWSVPLDKSEQIIAAMAGAKDVSFHITLKSGQRIDLTFPLNESKRVIDLLKRKGCGRSPANVADLPEAADWSFGISQPGSSRQRGNLTLVNRANMVELYCMGDGSWKLFIVGREIGEIADYTVPAIAYSIDGSDPLRMVGDKWRNGGRIDFDEATANRFVAQLDAAKSTFSFAVGTKKEMAVIDFSDGIIHDDVEQLLGRCPLKPN
jgi:hypothetical protein